MKPRCHPVLARLRLRINQKRPLTYRLAARCAASPLFSEYVTMVDDQLRHPDRHAPTVGILLCSSSTDGVVRYALRSANAPMAVATYTYDTLPAAEQAALPPAKAITAAFSGVGELTVRVEATGAVDEDPDGQRP
jgi:YhcG PDDEXK nuclease domain